MSCMNEKKIGVPLEEFPELCRRAAAEGAVLLKNEAETLPVKAGECIAIFGRIQKDTYRSGTGSGGAVNVAYTTNLLDSLRQCGEIKVNEEVAAVYEAWIAEHPFDDGAGLWAAEPWCQEEMELTEELVRRAAEVSDKALVVIGRTAGEARDYEDKEGGYRITERERQMISLVSSCFEKTALILNVTSVIDMGFLTEECGKRLTAVLYTWQGGQEGGRAAADVITGRVVPSGKLADTAAASLADYPSTRNHGSLTENIYQEDIYIGYRYFDTFAPEKVVYPFGFGLSYTEFSIEVLNECARKTGGGQLKTDGAALEGSETIELTVRVTNIGCVYSGREVVQVYYSAPQGLLGRPAKELAAFAKTKELAPGESETISLTFPVSAMAAYDDGGVTGHKSCYVLEKGLYKIYAGNSSRNLIPAGPGYMAESLVVTEELEEAAAPEKPFKRFRPGTEKPDGTYELVMEDVPVRTASLRERIEDCLPDEILQTGNRNITLQGVAAGHAAMDEFIAQLSDEELAAIVRGEGMCSPRVTPGTASAFGGVTDSLTEIYGIPTVCCADGPSGIRMDVGAKATQLPIGTLLSCTFDTELVENLYEMEGRELLRNEVDTLLGPGMNIHRNPLNGRNFEYYSEDPLLTGKMASAMIRGIAKGGAFATAKHFACNSQEAERNKVNAVVSERALREIYLKGFEIAVKEGEVCSIMTSYNPVNGHWSASNYDLVTTILRKEWGYQGIVMTDWWSTMNDPAEGGEATAKNTAAMVRAQNDLYMVVENLRAGENPAGDNTLEALAAGRLTRGELQRCAGNICRFILKAPVFARSLKPGGNIVKIPAGEYSGEPASGNAAMENKAMVSGTVEASRMSAKPGVIPGRFQVGIGEKTQFYAEQPGIYRLSVRARYDTGDSRAQSACNIFINGVLAATPQINGTAGAVAERKMGCVELETGYYELAVTETKMPGIMVEEVILEKTEK